MVLIIHPLSSFYPISFTTPFLTTFFSSRPPSVYVVFLSNDVYAFPKIWPLSFPVLKIIIGSLLRKFWIALSLLHHHGLFVQHLSQLIINIDVE